MDSLYPHAQNDNPSPEKYCKGCDTTYPATLEFFPPDKKGKNGLNSRCRICRRAYLNKRSKRPEIRERHNAYMKEYHARPEIKERTSAYNHEYESRPGVRERRQIRDRSEQRKLSQNAYNQRPEVKKRIREYYAQPHQKVRRAAYAKEYYARTDIQERRKQYQKNYYSNPLVAEHKRNWRKEYNQRPLIRAKNHVSRSARRAFLRSARGSHTAEQIQEQYARQKGKCYYCQVKVPCSRYHVDHVIPLTRDGSNDIGNLVIACPSCNLSKHNKLPHEFLKGGRLL